MIQGAQGKAIFSKEDTETLLELMHQQSSAKRRACQILQREPDITDNELTKRLQTKSLNDRYSRSAIQLAHIPKSSPLWGGKKLWEKMIQGEISKKEWTRRRNCTLFTSGDKSKKGGNAHFQIKGNNLKVRFPNRWLEGELKLFRQPVAAENYSYTLTHLKGREFLVHITWSTTKEPIKTLPGCISIDTNPTLLAWTNLNGEGNLLHHGSIHLPRVTQAKNGKRDHDILLGAKELVMIAKKAKKQIIIEKLFFCKRHRRPKGKPRQKRFNRMRHNFCYRALLTTIKREAEKQGVPFQEVFAGYTSILGLAKFSKMYSLNRHTSAAIIIGRRGLGIVQERQNFQIETNKSRSQGRRKTPRPESNDSAGRQSQPAKKTVCVRLRPASIETLQAKWLRGVTSVSTQRPGLTSPNSKRVKNPPHVDRRAGTRPRSRQVPTLVRTDTNTCPHVGQSNRPTTKRLKNPPLSPKKGR